MRRILLTVLLVILSLMLVVQPVMAQDWFVGNARTYAYGAKANIQAPYSQPNLYDGLVAAWVGTAINVNNSWAETGWTIPYGDTLHFFAEYIFYGGNQQLYWAQLDYGDNSSYRTEYDGGWKTYFNDQLLGYWSGGGLPTPPNEMRAWAEVRESDSNQLGTTFTNTSWKDVYGSWNYFDQNNLRQDSPYYTAYSTYYYYYCYGP